MPSKLFSGATYVDIRSKQKYNRSDLLSSDVARVLNTYRHSGVFATYNDVFSEHWDDKQQNDFKDIKLGTAGTRSIFNRYSTVLTGMDSPRTGDDKVYKDGFNKYVLNTSSWRLHNNVPLVDTPEIRQKLREMSGCSVRELVQASQQGYFGRAVYGYSDFMYCKYLGKVSNNYLITLRRYPIPTVDNMAPIGRGSTRYRGGAGHADTASPIGTMVTWMGVSGNEMKNILKYSYNMAFKEHTAEWEQVSREGGTEGPLNGLEAAFNQNARKLYNGGTAVPALDNYIGKMFGGQSSGPYSPEPFVDKNKVYGPIDRVKKIYMRSEDGLDWDQEFDLVFEYELRAYNGINPRQAMLDLIASILSVTYTTGGFWGGGYRGGGVSQASAFRNLNIFKCNGTFTDFVDALSKDVHAGIAALGALDIKDAIGKAMNAIGGLLIGGLINKLGRPARMKANSLLADQPVGLWHITIGNPHHPIMSMGNMILKKTTIEHSGPLGIDDFPTQLKVTCSFQRGRPRDQYGIENLYMSGNDRIFHSMDKHLADMYAASLDNDPANQAAARVGGGDQTNAVASQSTPSPGSKGLTGATVDTGASQGTSETARQMVTDGEIKATDKDAIALESTMSSRKEVLDQLKMYFGDPDATALMWASQEQYKGAFPKSKLTEQTSESNTQQG